MAVVQQTTLGDIEQGVCDTVARQFNIPRNSISPASRLIEDLHCDSIDLFELLTELEDLFEITMPASGHNPIVHAVFSRKGFRLSDLAECVYLQQGTGSPKRSARRVSKPIPEAQFGVPFCQLSGQWDDQSQLPLFEQIGEQKRYPQYRRRSDGMRCVMVPAATVEIGTDRSVFNKDCRPQHTVRLDAFLIDAETVSTTAYCRFLNTIGDVQHETLLDWFLLANCDDRTEHMLIEQSDAGWQPIAGCEKWPMILVSWYGANAYSLWANRNDWRNYRSSAVSFLPTEAQWEYAARGSQFQFYPWGNAPPSDELMRYGQHAVAETYTAATLPFAAVNETSGMSPFGLHHMAGNVWQWCRDGYDEQFYLRPEASEDNAFCRTETGVRSERGGSWVGPAEPCRSSHRRGRVPNAKGRCLGFRCVSDANEVT